MNATLVVSVVLGTGGVLTALWTLYTNVRDRPRHLQKQDGDVQLSTEQRKEVAAQAAKINSDERIATERWWKEQFDAVKLELKESKETAAAELAVERAWRKKITKYIRRHQPWDIEMERIARENNWPITPAPRIDLTGEDDDDPDQAMDVAPWHQ